MGIKVADSSLYEASIRKLFPQGEYWDKQFADINSDCSFFVQAKVGEFVRFRKRMSDLQDESVIQTANETIEDWERVYLGRVSSELNIEKRRSLLLSEKAGNISIEGIKEIGSMFGVIISEVIYPFRSAWFGHSYFGINRICSPASFSTLYIYTTEPTIELKDSFEMQIVSRLLAHNIIFFIYGGGT